MSEILLGSHISLSGPSFYEGSVAQALSFGENCFMFYTGAPQNSLRRPVSEMKIEEGRKLLLSKGVDESKIVVHAPYIINLASREKPDSLEFSKRFIASEISRVASFHLSLLVLHPGNSLKADRNESMECLAESLNEILESDSSNVTICLESMAGKGSEIGKSFDELAFIYSKIIKKERIGFCLDTCHLSDSGYDVNDVDGVLSEFDAKIGLAKIKVVHLNDSKNERGSSKDRHENIGYGKIGFQTLRKWAVDSRLEGIPKILETPVPENGKFPYEKEIEMLKEGRYVEGWRELL